MAAQIEIRRATIMDATAVAQLEQRCFDAEEAFSLRELRYLIARAQGGCYVACREEAIVGYISLLTRRTARNLRIYSLAVDPDLRGEGVGQRLVDTAKQVASERGLSEVTLEVRVDNDAALRLYARNGFCAEKILCGYYPDGTDAWRMKLRVKNVEWVNHLQSID